MARFRRGRLLPGSRVQRSPSNPALGVLPRAFNRARDAPGIAQARGFTLMEMLAVIVLIAIAVTVTAVSLHGRSRGQLDAAAQRVAAGLRDTRTRAMATRKPQWFSVDVRGHSFAAPGRDPRALPADATIDVTSAAEDATPQGVARIRFFPDGSSSGGKVELSDKGRDVAVAVDWLTGAVTVQPRGPKR